MNKKLFVVILAVVPSLANRRGYRTHEDKSLFIGIGNERLRRSY
jgi:hypothetical protein